MVNVVETSNKFILTCDYKDEQYHLRALLDSSFPKAIYSTGNYSQNPAIFLDKSSNISPELNSPEAMKEFLNENL